MSNRSKRASVGRNLLDISARRLAASIAMGALAFTLPAASQLLDVLDDVVDREIAEQVEQQVEADVAEQIQDDVAGAIEQQLESEIVSTVQQQVEADVVASIVTQVEASVAGEIGDQLLDAVAGDIDDVASELTDAVSGAAAGAGVGVGESADDEASRERFAADVDAAGRTIEDEVWIVLVPAEHAERIATWGFTIRERQNLATLDRVLLRIAAPEDRELAQAALELALDAPGTEVDFNHVYRPGADVEVDALTAAPAIPTGAAVRSPAPALSVGIVDTAVGVEHEALRGADIVQRDFVPFADERPTAHGTAVASILVGGAQLRPQLPGGRVYAASVFFTDTSGEDATTAASLTIAGEWLAAEGVRVINMSLAGPPNRVLEAAVAALVDRGVVVVAAVGNNGPMGEPLYPAAYANVVGVTAVDAAQRVYRYANRGPHVRFAAPGVDIRVAKGGGGYRGLSGTSVAAPHAAAVIARTLASSAHATPTAVLTELERAAVDLGAKDFDSVFGFGLIAPLAPVTASR
jgi:subtilisin family serine protease